MTLTAMPSARRKASDFGVLLAEVHRANLLERSWRLYLRRLTTTAGMTGLGVVLFVWVGDSWWTLGLAAYFAAVFGQLGFLGHDAGHQQIFSNRRHNDRLGLLLSNACVGLSYSWWIEKHSRHHRNPNDVDKDPDVGRNVLAWTTAQANEQHGVLGVIARHQAAFFFPLLVLEAFNLHVGSVRALAVNPRRHVGELALLALHVGGCITALLLVLSPLHALAFFGLQQGLFGLYLGSSFAPNHKGMHMINRDDGFDFLRRQVLTSRNVTGGRFVTAALGGLNYQIEHHLFPSMPSCNLRRCQPLVRRYCEARGVSYSESGLVDSYAQILRYFREIKPTPVLAR